MTLDALPVLTLGWWPSLVPVLIAMRLGQIAAGPLVRHFDRETVLVACGVLVLVATGLALCSREIRRLTTRPAAPAVPTGS